MENPTARQLSDWGLEKFPEHFDIILASQEETQIGVDNYPAFVNILQKGGGSEMYMQYFVIHGNDIYMLEFYLSNENDKDEDMLIFNRMLASFNILD